VGVPGQQEVIAISGELAEHSRLGRMQEPDAEICIRIGRASYLAVAIQFGVGIMNADQRYVQPRPP
jgi:hypothetical protein